MELIDKAAVIAEIKGLIQANELYLSEPKADEIRFQKVGAYSVLNDLLHFLDTLDTKEIDTTKVSKHSYFETVYHCGTEPMWKIGDVLAIYEFYSDREGEYVYGEVIGVKHDEAHNDWIYTMKGDFGGYEDIYEKELISQEAYKKQ